MPDRNIWLFTAAALVVVMLFFNRKVRLWAVLKEQIKVFKNAKKQRISLWDCLLLLLYRVQAYFGIAHSQEIHHSVFQITKEQEYAINYLYNTSLHK